MPRSKRPLLNTDFFVDVSGAGKFRFARKTYGDHIAIRAEHVRITRELGDDDRDLRGHAIVVSNYRVLMVECPDGWLDLESIAFDDPDVTEEQILNVYFALKEKLDSFRPPKVADKAGEGKGEGNVPDAGVLVPGQVQPVAEGSALS